MAKTRRLVNWKPVTFNSVTFTGVTQVSVDSGGSTIVFSGDDDHFPTTIIQDFQAPSVTITSADEEAIRSCINARGTFTATHLDAKNAATAGGGGLVYNGTGGVAESAQTSGSHRAYGSNTLMIKFESVDGVTNPLLSAAA